MHGLKLFLSKVGQERISYVLPEIVCHLRYMGFRMVALGVNAQDPVIYMMDGAGFLCFQ